MAASRAIRVQAGLLFNQCEAEWNHGRYQVDDIDVNKKRKRMRKLTFQ